MAAAGVAAIDSVLLVGFGGPEKPDDVQPFLRKVVEGREVPAERLQKVEARYLQLGGRSPYNELTEAQRRRLEAWLRERGVALPVYAGMRNWRPWLADTIARMVREGRRHAAAVILAAHRSPATWEHYLQDIEAARAAAGADGLQVTPIEPWFAAPGFLEANTARLEEVAGYARGSWPSEVPVVFTAHSIPLEAARRSPYVDDFTASCRGVADRLGLADWEAAYQSRSGNPRTPWLEPDVGEVVGRRAAQGVTEMAVQAIGFLCDHVEVLYDLDVDLRRTAEGLGVRLHRAACVNDHPAFIAELGERVLAAAGKPRMSKEKGK